MSLLRRLVYMGIGGALALALVIGGLAAFAQEDEPAEEVPAPEAENDASPGARAPRFGVEVRRPNDELLAEALGIPVEELEAAKDEARAAAIEQAVASGRLTEEQAETLLEGGVRIRPGFFGLADHDELLAEALGISVARLEAARVEAHAAMLAGLVEAGILTQEQADLMAARRAVRSYFDQEALVEMLQNAFQEAIDAALADGAITEDQAEQLLENGDYDFFGRGFGRPEHHGFRFAVPDLDEDTGIFVPRGRSDA